MQTIHVDLKLNAPAAFVFEQLADHAGYGQFPGVKSAKLLKQGQQEPNGVGAIRQIHTGPFIFEEIIEQYKVPTTLAYRITDSRPLPIRHQLGLITIAALNNQQCRTIWHSEFEIAVPLLGRMLGPVFRMRMEQGFTAVLQSIERQYQRCTSTSLVIRRDDLHQHHLAYQQPPRLKTGELRLEIDRFALTANNVTYAVLGDAMSYWEFFPADSGLGKLPVWGFANVIESKCAKISVGERVYGFFPFASQLVLQPAKLNSYGFVDASPHRRELPAVYNHYVRVAGDPAYKLQLEDLQALFRPLFSTAFLLDDFLLEKNFFEADTLVLSSASSKTALSCAFLLRKYRESRRPYHIIGLTSPDNLDFVNGLNCYDQVLPYAQIDQLDSQVNTVFVDFAGNVKLRKLVHQQCGDNLKYSCMVGVSHWSESKPGDPLPGPEPVLFFAPAQVKKRLAEWGNDKFAGQLSKATQAFFGFVQDKIEIQEISGAENARNTFDELLNGQLKPDQGYIVDWKG